MVKMRERGIPKTLDIFKKVYEMGTVIVKDFLFFTTQGRFSNKDILTF